MVSLGEAESREMYMTKGKLSLEAAGLVDIFPRLIPR